MGALSRIYMYKPYFVYVCVHNFIYDYNKKKGGNLPLENYYDKKTEDNQIHDAYRIHYLEEHLKELGKAIEEGCEVLAYCTWSFTDLLSWLNGYQKRYGFVYVDRDEEEGGILNRYKKDSFYWYQEVIQTDGKNLYK